MMKLEPGAPLPPDLPADAKRYRRVEDDEQADRRLIATGCVVGMSAAGVGLVWVGAPDLLVDVPFVLAGLAIAWAGWSWWCPTYRYVPSATGDYVVGTRSMVAEKLGSLAAPERGSMPARVICGALGASLALCATALAVVGLLGGDVSVLFVWLIATIISAWLLHVAVKGEYRSSSQRESGLPSSPWFRSLADPSRPLPDDAPVSGRPPGGAPPARRELEP